MEEDSFFDCREATQTQTLAADVSLSQAACQYSPVPLYRERSVSPEYATDVSAAGEDGLVQFSRWDHPLQQKICAGEWFRR